MSVKEFWSVFDGIMTKLQKKLDGFLFIRPLCKRRLLFVVVDVER